MPQIDPSVPQPVFTITEKAPPFPFSLDRPIPIEIIILIIFPVRCKKYFKKENSLDLHTFSAIGSRLATACLNVNAIVGTFNQEKALIGALSVITNLRMELFQALVHRMSGVTLSMCHV